jgi:hypothetical protein
LAVPSGSHDAAVTKQILDGDDVRIGIEHLRGHGVPQLVAADIQACLFCIMLHAILNAANLYGFAFKAALINQKQAFPPRAGSNLKIINQRPIGVLA